MIALVLELSEILERRLTEAGVPGADRCEAGYKMATRKAIVDLLVVAKNSRTTKSPTPPQPALPKRNETLRRPQDMSEEKDIQKPTDDEAVRWRDGSIGTHLARALADGRYDENKSWKYGRSQKRRPTDPIPEGALFGGQYSMIERSASEAYQGSSWTGL